jgi:hypothetical protein
MKNKIAKLLYNISVKLGYEVRKVNCNLQLNIIQKTTIGTPMELEGGYGTDFTKEQEVKKFKRYTFSFYLKVGDGDEIIYEMLSVEKAEPPLTFLTTS